MAHRGNDQLQNCKATRCIALDCAELTCKRRRAWGCTLDRYTKVRSKALILGEKENYPEGWVLMSLKSVKYASGASGYKYICTAGS